MKYSGYSISYFIIFSILCSTKVLLSQTQMNYEDFCLKQKSFQSADGNIKYTDRGEGEVILLLHGVPVSSWLYRKIIPGLVNGGYRVIAPDMLGFGTSDNPDAYEIYSQKSMLNGLLN